MSCGDLFLGLLAVLFPPIAVWIKRGICSADSLLNILLCILGFIPGLIHAWYIIAKFPDTDYDPVPGDEERVTYYYVSRDGLPPAQASPGIAGQPDGGRAHRELQRGGSAYGTLNGGFQQGSVRGQQARAQQPAEGQAGAGPSSGETPPTYAEAVKGDNKVQGS